MLILSQCYLQLSIASTYLEFQMCYVSIAPHPNFNCIIVFETFPNGVLIFNAHHEHNDAHLFCTPLNCVTDFFMRIFSRSWTLPCIIIWYLLLCIYVHRWVLVTATLTSCIATMYNRGASHHGYMVTLTCNTFDWLLHVKPFRRIVKMTLLLCHGSF